MLIKKIKNNLGNSLLLFLYIGFLIFLVWELIFNFDQQLEIIVLISTFLWILFCISQILINWRELNSEKVISLKVKKEAITSHSKWIKNNKISELLTLIVICIPLVVILIILGSSGDLFKSYTYTKQGYSLNNYGSTLFVIGLICQDIEKLFKTQSNTFKKIFRILSLILILVGFVIIMSANTQLIELAK